MPDRMCRINLKPSTARGCRLRTALGLLAALFILAGFDTPASAAPPIGYQGELLIEGDAFHGTAQFKFALVRDGGTVWSNDGTGTGGSEPTGAVSITVQNGFFAALLGGDGMSALPDDLAPAEGDLLLRVWVDTGSGFEVLGDQIVGASAFAFGSGAAERAAGDFQVPGVLRVDGPLEAGGVVGVAGNLIVAGEVTAAGGVSANGLRLLGGALIFPDGTQLSTAPSGGSGGGGIEALTNQDGAVAITNPNGPQAVVNLAPNGVTTLHVADGTLTNADLAPNAGIAESRLALNFPTHTNANDPTAVEKAALAGTDGAPGDGNRYVTNTDPRLNDPRVPGGTAGGSLAGAYPNPTLADATVVRSLNGLQDDVILAAGNNILLGQNGDTLVVSATGTEGVPSVNGITGPVTLVGAGGTVINTDGETITIASAGGAGTGIQGVQNTDNALAVTDPTGPTATINVKPAGITTQHLATSAVTSEKILDGTITSIDVADNSLRNADIATTAAIAESKLALNFPTHSNANDPNAGEKAALAGTVGAPGNANRYVTATDPRLNDARPPTGTAGGDLAGTYPNPSVDGLQGRPVIATAPANGQFLGWNGTAWGPTTPAGGGDSPWAASGSNVHRVEGNVGVGLTTPLNRLHLHNSDPFSGSPNSLQVTNAHSGATTGDGLHFGVFTAADGTYGGILNKEAGLLRFGTTNTYHMNLTQFGRLGLGTVSPAGQLDIHYNSGTTAPQLMITEDETGGYGRISYQSVGVAGKYWTTAVRSQADNAASQYNLYYFNGSTGGNVMSLNGSGRVGIGTNNPDATLHVNGDLRYAPVTGYYTVNPHEFTPSVSGYAFTVDTFDGLSKNDALAQQWRAPIHLPHGATIVSARLVYKDNNSSLNFFEIKINRLGIGTGNAGTSEVVAEFTPTGSGSSYRTLTQNTILKPSVDNQNWRYQLWLTYPIGVYSYSSISFVACVITYTTDRPY